MLLVSIRVRRGCEDYASCGREAMGTGKASLLFSRERGIVTRSFFFFPCRRSFLGQFCGDFLANRDAHGAGAVHLGRADAVCSGGAALRLAAHFVPSLRLVLVDSRCESSALAQHVWSAAAARRNRARARVKRRKDHASFSSLTFNCLTSYGFLNMFPSDVIAAQVNHAPVDFFLFFGTSIYVFEGINMALVRKKKRIFFIVIVVLQPVHREMRNPESFTKMFSLVSLTLFLVFSGFAVRSLSAFIFCSLSSLFFFFVVLFLHGSLSSLFSLSLSSYVSFLDTVQPISIYNLPPRSGWQIAVLVIGKELFLEQCIL